MFVEWTKPSFCRRASLVPAVKLFSYHLPQWLKSKWFPPGSLIITSFCCFHGPLNLVLSLDFGLWCLFPASAFSLLLIFWFGLLCLTLSSKPMISCLLGLLELQDPAFSVSSILLPQTPPYPWKPLLYFVSVGMPLPHILYKWMWSFMTASFT